MSVLFGGLLTFAISSSITPGPNNMMLTSSGATFGLRRSMPHMLGVAMGFPAMAAAVGLGLSQTLAAYPQIHLILKYVGAAYLLYLAYKVARSARPEPGEVVATPLTWTQAALFQWVNPKAWMMVLSAIPLYTTIDGSPTRDALALAAVFAMVSLPACLLWTSFGNLVGHWLKTDRSLRIFNLIMALLLVLSVIPMLA
jgi:threonine/homoserine/homoserine lactone efflux protein